MAEIYVPRENVNDESVVILKTYFDSGAAVKAGDIVVDLETSKTNISILAPEDGIVVHGLNDNMEVKVGALLFSVIDGKEVGATPAAGPEEVKPSISTKRILSHKAAEKIAALGLTVDHIGDGWITADDIDKYVEKKSVPRNITAECEPTVLPTLRNLVVANTTHKLNMRKRAEVASLTVGNHFATTSTIGMLISVPGKRLVAPHELFTDSITDLVVFESAKLLKKYNSLNATYLDDLKWAAYDEVNFGWSFDNGNNLKVLAVKSADKLSLCELQDEVMRLLDFYESGETIPIDLLTASTVTVSDLSQSAASFMLPLINGNQSLILGIVKSDRNIFEIFASFDHRLSDGAEVTNFLTELRDRVLTYFFDENGVGYINCCACDKPMSEELALGLRGFTKIVLKDGSEGSICRNCFDGF